MTWGTTEERRKQEVNQRNSPHPEKLSRREYFFYGIERHGKQRRSGGSKRLTRGIPLIRINFHGENIFFTVLNDMVNNGGTEEARG
jgi:hypothetical protein